MARPLHAVALIICFVFALAPDRAHSDDYPTRPIRIIVPNEPGGVYDFVGRQLADQLTSRLRERVYVENRPGGGSVVGTHVAASAAPDGYTLLMGGLSNIVFNAGLYPDLSYDPLRDFVPVALVYTFPYVLVARKDLPVSDLSSLIAAMRQKPNAFSIGSPGIGSVPQVLGAALMSAARAKLVEVPYKGVQAPMNDLLAGRIDILFVSESAAIGHLRSGTLKAIASAGAHRSAALPDLPTMQEAGLPGLAMEGWLGLFAPSKIPPSALERLRSETVGGLSDLEPHFKAVGETAMHMTTEETRRFVQSEFDKWTRLIKDAGIRARN